MNDVVTKIDQRQVQRWLEELRKVLPVIPSKDGLVLTANDRPLFRFVMNSANGGLTPMEAYAFAGILENLKGIVDAAQSQQRDFVMVRRALQHMLNNPTDKNRQMAIEIVEETTYIEGKS